MRLISDDFKILVAILVERRRLALELSDVHETGVREGRALRSAGAHDWSVGMIGSGGGNQHASAGGRCRGEALVPCGMGKLEAARRGVKCGRTL